MEDPNTPNTRNTSNAPKYKSEHLTFSEINILYRGALLAASPIIPIVSAGDYRLQQQYLRVAACGKHALIGEFIEYSSDTHETCIVVSVNDTKEFLEKCGMPDALRPRSGSQETGASFSISPNIPTTGENDNVT